MSRSPAPLSPRRIGRSVCGSLAAVLISAGPLVGQVRDRDARIPQAGSLWIEVAPEFYNWNEQFSDGGDSPEEGQREPVYSNYDGSMAERLFPGLDPMLTAVNRGSEELGFTPLTATDLNLGTLDFGSIDYLERRIPLGLQFGIGGFAALEVSAPLVKTEVETGFTFDSASAGIVGGASVLADPAAFFSQFDAAQAQLEAVLAGGGLSPADSAAILQLLADSESFQRALGAKIEPGQYLFTAGSSAGQQITGNYVGFETGFEAYGVTLPAFSLPTSATRSDLNYYFQSDPVVAQPLQNVTYGWAIPEIQLGLRLKLVDTFGWPERPAAPASSEATESPAETVELDSVTVQPPMPADSLAARADSTAVRDSAAAPVAMAPEDSLPASDSLAAPDGSSPPGIRFRTTVGARYQLPLGNPDEDPYVDPSVFLQQPVGTGTPALEIELYQDIGFGHRFLTVVGATYGIQMETDLVRRVAPPGQPYAYASQTTDVAWDPGDFLRIVVSPRFSLTEALSLAAEYTYWDKKQDSYRSLGGVEAAPLDLETAQTRHMLGIGAYYRTTRLYAAGRAGVPVDIAFLWQTAIAGQGGLTPALGVASFSLRVPMQLF